MARSPLLPLVFALVAASPCRGGEKGADLAKALDNVIGAKSYTFQVKEKPAPAPEEPFVGRFVKSQPLYCKVGAMECFRDGEEVAYLDSGQWLRSKRGTESDPLRVLGVVARVRAVKLPHEELAKLRPLAAKLAQADKGPGRWRADFGEQDAKALAPTQYQQVARDGRIELMIGPDGLERYSLEIRLQGRLGNADVDGTFNREVMLRDVDATQVELPEAVRRLLPRP